MASVDPPPADFRLGYRRWLDGLRGVAILIVFGFHLHLIPAGFLGVDLFFVLSGFLITALLAEEWRARGQLDLPRFYLRRVLRLMPAYVALLAVCALAFTVRPRPEWETGYRAILVAGTYVTNWPTLHQTPMPLLGHTWSLAIEEQFYLLWPLTLLALLRSGLPHGVVFGVVCGLLAGAAVWRAALFAAGPPDLNRLYMGLDTRADTLLVGCAVGLMAVWGWLPTGRWFVRTSGVAAVAAAAALAVLLNSYWHHHAPYYDGLFTVAALLVAVVLVRLLVAPAGVVGRILESRLLVLPGRLSYSLYLVHTPVFETVNLWDVTPLEGAILAMTITFATAIPLHLLIERPFLRLKRRARRPCDGVTAPRSS